MTMILGPDATSPDARDRGAHLVISGPPAAAALSVTTTERRLTAAGMRLPQWRAGRIAFVEVCRIARDHGLAVVVNVGSSPHAFVTREDVAAIADHRSS